MLSPTAVINATIVSGLPEGWEHSEAAAGFFGPDLAMVEAKATRKGFVWEATTADLDYKTFGPTKVREAMAWAEAN
tara:strand:+ start:261 stop:488 length:228 start_codon:yes stop_codon:yes gene_type:complete